MELRQEEYKEMFKAVAPKIEQHTMEIAPLENGRGVRIQKVQPPTRFLVGEFTYDEEGWQKLHEECPFLADEEKQQER